MGEDSRVQPEQSRRAIVAALLGVSVSGCTTRSVGGDGGADSTATDVADASTDAEPTGTGEPDTTSSASDYGSPTPDAWEPADGLPSAASVDETTVVSGLEIPWDLTFAGDDAFFTEREKGVRRISTKTLVSGAGITAEDTQLVVAKEDLPNYETIDFSGFLGVAAHPEYPDPPHIYLYHSYDDGDPQNRVIRYDLEREEVTVLVEGIPGTGYHHGGRLAFGPDDDLWVTTGDANQGELAQDPTSLAGAVLRVTPDGTPSPENPSFDGDADPRVVTKGHRNPQAIIFTPDGEPFVAEHGPKSRDEVLSLEPGANYGWPIARGGPNDPKYESYSENDGFTPPVVNTGPETTWAPSGATFYTDDAIEAWRNRLFVCGLISQTLYAVTLVRPEAAEEPPLGEEGVRYDGSWLDGQFTATAHPLYAGEYGRLRHAEQGPNGSLFLLTSNRDGRISDEFPKAEDDRIVRIDPR